ncbi:MAG: sulfotransferase [Acidobacteriota bacterium]
MLDRPVFVVGSVRSGTALLARSLGAHPALHYVINTDPELFDDWIHIGCAPMRETCPTLGPDAVTPEVRDALHRHFAALLAREATDGRFLNKNPHLWNKLGYLRAIFPDAALVVTSRDMRSTVASTKRMFESHARNRSLIHRLPAEPGTCWRILPARDEHSASDPEVVRRTFPGGDVRVIAEYWLRVYATIETERTGFDSVAVVRHRDFVEAPESTLDRVATALSIEPRSVELPDVIRRGRNTRWRELLDDREQRDLEIFIAEHADRIAALRCADTTLA